MATDLVAFGIFPDRANFEAALDRRREEEEEDEHGAKHGRSVAHGDPSHGAGRAQRRQDCGWGAISQGPCGERQPAYRFAD